MARYLAVFLASGHEAPPEKRRLPAPAGSLF